MAEFIRRGRSLTEKKIVGCCNQKLVATTKCFSWRVTNQHFHGANWSLRCTDRIRSSQPKLRMHQSTLQLRQLEIPISAAKYANKTVLIVRTIFFIVFCAGRRRLATIQKVQEAHAASPAMCDFSNNFAYQFQSVSLTESLATRHLIALRGVATATPAPHHTAHSQFLTKKNC